MLGLLLIFLNICNRSNNILSKKNKTKIIVKKVIFYIFPLKLNELNLINETQYFDLYVYMCMTLIHI